MENNGHTIYPIAHFCSPFKSKFGIPRQSGLIEERFIQYILQEK